MVGALVELRGAHADQHGDGGDGVLAVVDGVLGRDGDGDGDVLGEVAGPQCPELALKNSVHGLCAQLDSVVVGAGVHCKSDQSGW